MNISVRQTGTGPRDRRPDRPGRAPQFLTGLLLLAVTQSGMAASFVRFELAVPGTGCQCDSGEFGAWPNSIDDYDTVRDRMIGDPTTDRGHVAAYHEQGADWSGQTGFYDRDHRSEPAAGESFTWTNIYMWVPPIFEADEMEFNVDGRFNKDLTFTLRLEAVPSGVTGAPAVGTSWELPKDSSFELLLPVHKTDDGLTGYRFSLTMTNPAPPGACAPAMPAMVLTLGTGMWLLTRTGRRR